MGDVAWTDVGQAVLRWAHIVAGIIWIGHLYFFNWVNGPFAATLDAESKRKVVPELMPRALYWFRWGAAWTWITGILILGLVFHSSKSMMFGAGGGWSAGGGIMVLLLFVSPFIYDPLVRAPFAKKGPAMFWTGAVLATLLFAAFLMVGKLSYRASVIHLGGTFGTLMAYNVWFVIWPAQKKIIAAIKAGQAPDAALAGLAGMRSKHNTYMSIPLVWAMIEQHTAGSFAAFPGTIPLGDTSLPLSMPLAIVLGWWFCSWCYKKGAAVKGF
jgi:uncharacterized membrane protein